jgi:hypothetical protein
LRSSGRAEELDRDAIDEILGEFDLFTPVVAVQRAHGLLSPGGTPEAGSGARDLARA